MSPFEERRRHKRRPIDKDFEGSRSVTEAKPEVAVDFACHGVDVSEGGMQILTVAPLEAGQRISLYLKAEGGRSLVAEAEVRWVRAEKDTYRVGLEFVKKEEAFIV